MFPYTISDQAVTVFVDGLPRTFPSTHGSFESIKDAILKGDENMVRELSDVKANISRVTFGRVKIFDNEIQVDGRIVSGKLIDRILEMVRLGSQAIEGYVAFLDNLMDNPRESAVNELYEFIEACNLPITPDGHFLAYRYVNEDWKDSHSRSVFAKPADLMTEDELASYSKGVVGGKRDEVTTQVVDGVTNVSMPRNMVDDVRTNTCSRGLHFCSISYLPSYGSGNHILVVKINPAHVVSIPEEYNLNKGRTEAYQVVGTINHEEAEITPWFTSEYEVDDDTGEILDSELDFEFDDLADDFGPDDLDDDLEVDDLVDESQVDTTYDPSGDKTASAGDTDYSQKLCWNDVNEIRALFAEGVMTLTDIADAYHISRRQAARIRDREVWISDDS